MLDLRNIYWGKGLKASGTQGCYFKATINNEYYKLSSFNNIIGFFGHEAINEVVVSRLGKILGFNVLEQVLKDVLVNIQGIEYRTYACKSKNYVTNGFTRMKFENFFAVYRRKDESIYNFINRYGLQKYFNIMYVLDFIIINRDRHGANIEVLLDNNKKLKMALYFDNGLSFTCSITKDIQNYKNQIISFDPLCNLPVNNYIGSRSLYDNLNLVSKPVRVNPLRKEDKKRIFYGLNTVIDDFHREKIWQIITYRYSFLRKRGLIIDKNI